MWKRLVEEERKTRRLAVPLRHHAAKARLRAEPIAQQISLRRRHRLRPAFSLC